MTTTPALTEASTSKTVTVNGMPIHYHEAGQGEPVVLLPAGPSNGPASTAWLHYSKTLPALSRHFRCIAMDLVNYGKTGPVTFHEPVHDVQARAVLALVDALGIRQAHFVGNSVGGTTAIDFALRHPERVRRLVVGGCHASTGGDPYLLANRPPEMSRVTRKAFNNPTRETFREYLEVNFHDQSLVTDELVDYLLRNFLDHPDHVAARRDSVSMPHSNMADLPCIKHKTLIIHGRHDRMVPVEQAIMILNYIGDSRLVILNNCGSWAPYEQPDDYNREVLAFLRA
ncbi:MAG: alpha/beta fold hydrolase [SAR202 cluster bacterium]|nr:alpha/beta fold hydrolase [SAR202 cluster bacterium]